jgi:hypothetical protein
MNYKSLGLLLLLAGCDEAPKVEWVYPDSACYEIHDSSEAVDVAGDSSSAVDAAQSISPSADTSQAAD